MIKEHLSCGTLKSFVYDTFKTSCKIIIKSTGFSQPLSKMNPKLKLIVVMQNYKIYQPIKNMFLGYMVYVHLMKVFKILFSICFLIFFSLLVEICLIMFILGWKEVGLQGGRMRFLTPLQIILLKIFFVVTV